MNRPCQVIFASALLALSSGWPLTSDAAPTGPPTPPAALANLPLTLSVKQRTTTEVPGAGGELRLTVEDVTRGQVMATLSRQDGGPLIALTSFAEGDEQRFKLGDTEYRLTLKKLSNDLIGDDFAEFEISQPAPTSDDASRQLTEEEKIERLIAHVEGMQGAAFIRNGESHDTHEAAAHLRKKWQAAGERISTAEEFIEHLASKSSLSGKAYEIRRPDGSVVEAAPYLRERLAQIVNRAADNQPPQDDRRSVLEGTLMVNPKFLYHYYLQLDSGQICALYGQDRDRQPEVLSSLEEGSRIRVRGAFGSFYYPSGKDPQLSALPPTWVVYMAVEEAEAIGDRDPSPAHDAP